MSTKTTNVVVEVADGNVVAIKIDVEDGEKVISVNGDGIVITPPEEIPYEEYTDDEADAIETLAGLLTPTKTPDNGLEAEWSQVYDRCKRKGQIVLQALYEHGEETEDGLRVNYSHIKSALEDAGKPVKGKTMPGIIRGINTQIRDYVTGVESRDDAKHHVLPQVRDENNDRCRLLVHEWNGQRHAEAFMAAMDEKDL